MPREYLTPIETARQRFAGRRATDAVQTTENIGDPEVEVREATDDDRPSTRDQALKDAELERQERRQRHGTR